MNMQPDLFDPNNQDIEREVEAQRKQIKYWTVEPTVELHAKKLVDQDYFIPDYQRELTWEQDKQSKFIESILMGLPIPFITGVEEPSEEGSIAIVDGGQRLRSLVEFTQNRLRLTGLEVLDVCNGLYFDSLPISIKRKFNNHPIRMVLLDGADTSTQFTLFERINTTGKRLSYAEIRRGAYPGPMTDLMVRLAEDELFVSLTDMSEQKVKEREREELVLRFFCYSERYNDFRHDVRRFLDEYLQDMNRLFMSDDSLINHYQEKFAELCSAASRLLPNGFQSPGRHQVPRVRFEALSVGLHLALQENESVSPQDLSWLDDTDRDSEFGVHIRTDASNSAPKMKARIEYVRDKLLEHS